MRSGESIGGYKIERLLGEGGMGAVYLARHELLGRTAAVKLLLPQYCNNADIVDRFFREAKASTAINHPGIVQIFDFGYHDDGSAYIVMEYLEGEALAERMLRLGRLPPEQASRLCRQVAGALHAAHEAGIVHRDLKPDNIFLVPDPDIVGGERAKVLDFGIAKLTGPGDTTKTKTGAVMGTPVYMSPEQCRGAGEVDRRADIYALGCVFFHMLCGHPPFDYEGIGELFMAHLQQQPPTPSSEGLPPVFDGVINTAMAKEPGSRYQTMDDLGDALVRAEPKAASAPQLPTVAAAVGHQPSGAMPMPTPPPAHHQSGAVARPNPTNPASPTTLAQSSGVAYQTPPPMYAGGGSKKTAIWAGLAVLLAGGAVTAAVLASGGQSKTAAAPDIDAAPVAQAIDAAPVEPDPEIDAAPEVERVTVTIESEPDRARVRLTEDGPAIGFTPFTQTIPEPEGKKVYYLTKNGHEPAAVEVSARTNWRAAQVLEEIKTSSNRPRPRPKPKPKPKPKPNNDDPGSYR